MLLDESQKGNNIRVEWKGVKRGIRLGRKKREEIERETERSGQA